MVITMSRCPAFTRSPSELYDQSLCGSFVSVRLAFGCTSHCSLSDAADTLERGFDRDRVPGIDQTLQLVQRGAEGAEGFRKTLPVLLEDLAPHLGVGRRDAGGVLESAPRDLEEARVHAHHRVH